MRVETGHGDRTGDGTAELLQRILLPGRLPDAAGLRTAHRYLPADRTTGVGGDWYDAVPMVGGRTALVVGDVMGHGPASAAVMGQLRTTTQTLAMLDLPPVEVLHHLDEQAQRLGEGHLSTCLMAVYSPASGRCELSNAGHVPAVWLHADGRSELLRPPPGLPIGVGGTAFEQLDVFTRPGDVLVLVTDGVVETRARGAEEGLEELRSWLAVSAGAPPEGHLPAAPGFRWPSPEELCQAALDTLRRGPRDDDAALLVAALDGVPARDMARWALTPDARAASAARRLVRRTLGEWGLGDLSDATQLAVSELVTNAARYARGPVTLYLHRGEGMLRCEVGDDDPRLPRRRFADADEEHGRGLALVSLVASRWGSSRAQGGKVVWFELDG
ncbi:ATP-binding SpoIIE family protein phosphatase [Allostreptomyces psammosilenae]|uniref:protein-serine/threonine phosphatase n=1 Tax=Allostreptomyces psammosilenae TaxID=1892865 RepID=A0A853A1M3_9ACTN|nr:ATP-binding SpoIIE family protein phosphatase [Allostreptomyces psammosilenae]NYI08037.1 anti-sigma regulatory factor (Ser/Thr protein kinase) [Allostreptomyces psammosilenae]